MKKIFAAIGLMLLLQNAWAIDIGAAKAQGLVGEANTGYIAAVQKASFEGTARKTGTSVAQVANRFHELAIQKTAAGNYYQDAGGRWRKK